MSRSNRNNNAKRSGNGGTTLPPEPHCEICRVDAEITDERLEDISGPMLDHELDLLETPETHENGNLVRIPNITLSDPRLAEIIPTEERRRSRAGDDLRRLVVRVVLCVWAFTLVFLLGIMGWFAFASENIVEAAEALSKFLDAAGLFLKMVFGGSTLALIILVVFNRKLPGDRDDRHDDKDEPQQRKGQNRHEGRNGADQQRPRE